MKYKRSDFLALLLSDSPKVSIKRFATFLAVMHFFVLSFVATFTRREFFNQDILQSILDIDKWIISIGLGVITAQNVAQVIVNKIKTSQNDTSQPPVEQVPDDPTNPK